MPVIMLLLLLLLAGCGGATTPDAELWPVDLDCAAHLDQLAASDGPELGGSDFGGDLSDAGAADLGDGEGETEHVGEGIEDTEPALPVECWDSGFTQGITGTVYVDTQVSASATLWLWGGYRQPTSPCSSAPIVWEMVVKAVEFPLTYGKEIPKPGKYWLQAAMDKDGDGSCDCGQVYLVDGVPTPVVVEQGGVVCGVDFHLP